VDDEWPIWYAGYLLDKMRKMLNSGFTKSELIYILVSAEKENGWPQVRTGPDSIQISSLADTHNIYKYPHRTQLIAV